jgi:hypothetical protein
MFRYRLFMPGAASVLAILLAGARDAIAQDLEAGVGDASTKLKKIFKLGVGVFAVVIVVIGLMTSGFKFTQKDPSAVLYLVGTVAGGVLCAVAAAML